jgi:hypothetical protein
MRRVSEQAINDLRVERERAAAVNERAAAKTTREVSNEAAALMKENLQLRKSNDALSSDLEKNLALVAEVRGWGWWWLRRAGVNWGVYAAWAYLGVCPPRVLCPRW